MRYLVLTLRKPHFQESILPAHMAFINELRIQGKIEMAGGFTDKTGGAYILRVDSLAEARAIADQDPVHVSGNSEVSVREWNAA